MLFVNWWINLEATQQIFWSIALVSSVLLSILLVINLFRWNVDHDPAAKSKEKNSRLTEPKVVLTAFTFFGWSALAASFFTENLQIILVVAVVAAILGALLPWLLPPFFVRSHLDADVVLKSTGRVLQSIPPHRNGFGKVHLNMRTAPYEMDAVTAGGELPAGARVRIVDILDERVLLVEAIDDHPGAEPGKVDPAAPRTGRSGPHLR